MKLILRSFVIRIAVLSISFLSIGTGPVFGQMTTEQRLFDFQVLTSLYAKRYAPANWKMEAIGVNIFEVKPWADQVRAAKSDLEYFEIASRFVGSFQDGHTGYSTPSRFRADLGFYVDIYDGKVLIETIVRSRLPVASYPFVIGDELVSLDGKPVEEILNELGPQQSYANPRTTRRASADAITFRLQSEYPRAVELPDSSQVEIRRASGNLETYTIRWTKTGEPVRSVGPVPSPVFGVKAGAKEAPADPMRLLNELHDWSVSTERYAGRRRVFEAENGEMVERSYVTGWGGRTPYFNMPQGFQLRQGRVGSDPFYSGVYVSEGNRIGYLRIPSFGPNVPSSVALGLLDAEIAFFRANTDGLVIDVSRNTGGGCIGLDYAARLVPNRFWFFGEQLRPTLGLLSSFENTLSSARALGAEQWVIDTYAAIVSELRESIKENRPMTGPMPACTSTQISPVMRPATFENEPLTAQNGEVLAYEKPIIFLADEFSVSFGDIFPAMMQDNRRGPIVGMRTGGWGGSISGWPAGHYSEASATNTNSLVVRRQNVSVPGFPSKPYIENLGVVPDIELDFMTRENLMTGGGPFVAEFTKIINAEIGKAKRP